MNIDILQTAKEQLVVRSSRNIMHAEHCQNIESIKIFLLLPFLQFLGYDITNPEEIFPDYLFDSLGQPSADLVLLHDSKPIILFNVVMPDGFNDAARDRLKNLFFNAAHSYNLTMAILTDGLVYEVYTDLCQPKVMDSMPYFSFSMRSFVSEAVLDSSVVEDIAFLSKSYFNPSEVFSRALLSAVRHYGRDALSSFMEGDAFVRMVVEKVAELKDYDMARISDSLVALSKPIVLSFLTSLSSASSALPNDHGADLSLMEKEFVDYAISIIIQFLEKQKTSDSYLKKVHALKEKQFLQLYYSSQTLGVFLAVQEKQLDDSAHKRWDVRFSASENPLLLEGNDLLHAAKASSDFQPLLLKSFTAVVNNTKL